MSRRPSGFARFRNRRCGMPDAYQNGPIGAIAPNSRADSFRKRRARSSRLNRQCRFFTDTAACPGGKIRRFPPGAGKNRSSRNRRSLNRRGRSRAHRHAVKSWARPAYKKRYRRRAISPPCESIRRYHKFRGTLRPPRKRDVESFANPAGSFPTIRYESAGGS